MQRVSVLALFLLACGTPAGPEAPPAETCKTTLAARVSTPVAPLPMTIAASTIPVELQIPFAKVSQELESRVPRRVAEEKDHDIGIAGRLEYVADRGAFTARMQGDSLAVETPISIHAKACAKGTCYAGCDPEARAVATLPMRLDANYKFRPSVVRVEVTKGCSVRALGGLVTVDVTGMLRDELSKAARQLAAAIDKKLPDLRPEAENLFVELGKPRSLPLGACALLAPEGIVQGVPTADASAAKLHFALIGRPELRVRCGDAKASTAPLPPLRDGATEGDTHLAIVMPPEAISLDGLTADKTRITHARGTPGALEADIRGEACGTIFFGASTAAWLDASRLHLGGVVGDPAFPGLTAAVENAPIAVPFAPDQLATTAPALASAVSDPTVEVSAAVVEAKAESAGIRGTDIVAVVQARGSVTLRAK